MICTSPKLVAAIHVLHRLLAPRHSPSALLSLTISFERDAAKLRPLAFVLSDSSGSVLGLGRFSIAEDKRTSAHALACQSVAFRSSAGGGIVTRFDPHGCEIKLTSAWTQKAIRLPRFDLQCSLRPPVAGGESRRTRTTTFRRRSKKHVRDGGAGRDRTDDLRLAKPALSQLSYSPGW